jgi:CII-binding regulator of phage lambda lysogenization HflD
MTDVNEATILSELYDEVESLREALRAIHNAMGRKFSLQDDHYQRLTDRYVRLEEKVNHIYQAVDRIENKFDRILNQVDMALRQSHEWYGPPKQIDTRD